MWHPVWQSHVAQRGRLGAPDLDLGLRVGVTGYDLGSRPLGEVVGSRAALAWQWDEWSRPVQVELPAVMTVGGWFDAEDLYGPLQIYRAVERKNPGIFNMLVMGPWRHGGWARGDGAAGPGVAIGPCGYWTGGGGDEHATRPAAASPATMVRIIRLLILYTDTRARFRPFSNSCMRSLT